MPEYKYIAVDNTGKKIQGQEKANNSQEFLAMISARGLYCLEHIEVSVKRQVDSGYRMKTREVVFFCKQLETMLSAGVTLSRIFQILSEKTTLQKQKAAYLGIYEAIQKGSTLSDAMKEQGRAFPSLLIHMVASGEIGGTLDEITAKMVVHYSNELKLNNRVKSAMIYPILLLVVSIGVVLLLFTMVLPNLFTMFGDTAALPAITQVLFGFSDILINYWYFILAGVFFIIMVFYAALQTKSGRLFNDTMIISIPVIGKLLRIIYTARFANSIATLYQSGIPILKTLEISAEVVGNVYYKQRFQDIIEMVSSGSSLAQSCEAVALFDSLFISLVYVGEESGSLDQVLSQAAVYYDMEAQGALERMAALLEPIMIIILAGIVGTVVVGVLVPMYDMYGGIL